MNRFEVQDLLEHYFQDSNITFDAAPSLNGHNVLGRFHVDGKLAFKGIENGDNYHPCNTYRTMGLKDVDGNILS